MPVPDFDNEGCVNVNVTASGVPPNVLIVLDRSSSMNEMITGGTKWNVGRTGIINLLNTFTGQVRFGLALYPGQNLVCESATSCTVPGERGNVFVDPGPSTVAQITDQLSAPAPAVTTCSQGTPTTETLANLTGYAGLEDTARSNYILLVTDGQHSCDDNPENSAAALLAQSPSIRTFVVGFGSGVDPGELNAIATSGGTTRVGGPPHYYVANDPTALATAFNAIVGSVISCDLTLSGSLTMPMNACTDGTILLDGSMLDCQGMNCGAADGWCVVNPTTIRLLGTTCADFQNTPNANVSGSFRCGSFTPT
jgi:hypothetical protein